MQPINNNFDCYRHLRGSSTPRTVSLISQSFLLIFLVLSSLANAEIISVVMLLITVFICFDPVVRSSIWYCPELTPFFTIVLIGLIGIFYNNIYDVLKDCWYIGNVILTITFGYLVMIRFKDIRVVLKIFVFAAFIVSVHHLMQFALDPNLIRLSYDEIRNSVSSGYILPVLGTAIVLGDMKNGLNLFHSKNMTLTVLAIYIISILLFFSRTHTLCLITVLLVMNSQYKVRSLLKAFLVLAAIVVFIVFIVNTFIVVDASNIGVPFIGKTMNSINEVTMSNYNDISDINTNWRGFESYRAMQTFLGGNPIELFLGRGFGTNIDLGTTIKLGETEYEEIPILHNGYMYILVKTGLIGLLLFLIFFYKLLVNGNVMSSSSLTINKFNGRMLVTLVLILIQTTMVISGVFNKSGLLQATLLIGFILGFNKITEYSQIKS